MPSIDARHSLAALALVLALAGCATSPAPAPPDAPPERAHHRELQFQNRHLEFGTKPFEDFLRWRFNAWRNGLPPPPAEPIPAVEADRAFIAANARAGAAMQPTVTWIGHATVLLQLGGLNVITDPIFSERASPLDFVGPKRHQPPGLRLDELPRIDVVVLSHDHYDSTDAASLAALARQAGGSPRFLVPLGLGTLLRSIGIERVDDLDWWQSRTIDGATGPVEFTLTPAQHWSGRRLDDRMRTLWGGWAILAPDLHAWFAGDTGYSKDFVDIRERFAARQTRARGGGFDIALIPIGAYEPRWFMRDAHVNPEEALMIHADVGAKRSLGIHWGTFPLTDEPLDQPPRDLAAARAARGVGEDAFFVLPIGATKLIPRR
jgi:N-acyl-phosphatidylethanolamine-hydrolysing phospholipase D